MRGTSDIGVTYIEISIEAQHMWYYEDGQLYMDTDVVTGKGGNHTKRGVGYIHNKARNATLVGLNGNLYVGNTDVTGAPHQMCIRDRL